MGNFIFIRPFKLNVIQLVFRIFFYTYVFRSKKNEGVKLMLEMFVIDGKEISRLQNVLKVSMIRG